MYHGSVCYVGWRQRPKRGLSAISSLVVVGGRCFGVVVFAVFGVEGEDLKMKNKILYNMDERFPKNFSSGKLTKKNILASIGAVSLLLLAVGGAVAQTSGDTASVSIGSNGIEINLGQLQMNGNDINGINSLKDTSGDEVLQVNDSSNSVEIKNGFRVPTGSDAYN